MFVGDPRVLEQVPQLTSSGWAHPECRRELLYTGPCHERLHHGLNDTPQRCGRGGFSLIQRFRNRTTNEVHMNVVNFLSGVLADIE